MKKFIHRFVGTVGLEAAISWIVRIMNVNGCLAPIIAGMLTGLSHPLIFWPT